MNRRRSRVTTTHQPRHDRYQLQETETPLAPDLRAWVRSLARQYGASEQYLIDSCIKEHGTDGVAVAKMMADQFQQMINDWQTSNLHFTLVPVTKPSPDERTIVIKLSDDDDDIKLRVWGDPFNDAHFFCFDFINGQGEYIRTPPDVRIYSDANGPGRSVEVLSMERSWPGPAVPRTWPGYDPNWETYGIAEGSKIRIIRPGYPDCHLTIPSRKPRDGRYAVVPEYW